MGPRRALSKRGSNLHFYVSEALGEEDLSRLELYTAAGSAFDRFHGVDRWLEYNGRTATIGITAQAGKANGYKADVMILLRYGTDQELEAHASRIVNVLKEGAEPRTWSF